VGETRAVRGAEASDERHGALHLAQHFGPTTFQTGPTFGDPDLLDSRLGQQVIHVPAHLFAIPIQVPSDASPKPSGPECAPHIEIIASGEEIRTQFTHGDLPWRIQTDDEYVGPTGVVELIIH